MSPSSPLSSNNLTTLQPSTSQSILLQSFSPPHQVNLPRFPRPALLSYPQTLPSRILDLQASPPGTISLFGKPSYGASRSSPPSNYMSESSVEGGFNGQSAILRILLPVLFIVIIIALIICLGKRKKGVSLNSDRSPPPPPNDGLCEGPPPQQSLQVSHIPGVHDYPMPWNIILPPLQLSNNVDSSLKEIQANPVCFCGRDFTILDINLATRWFSAENFLGESEFGCVHKGLLPNGKYIAVKMLKMSSRKAMHDFFEKEVEIISRVRHKHLVSMIGYCIAERLLVNEFVPNNNLEFHLHGIGQPVMKWETRRRIAIGTAKGLAYLHEDCEPSIIHLQLKASNILLDLDFEAKVADFGIAKFLSGTDDDDDDDDDVPSSLTGVNENSGYRAPEYTKSSRASAKSDVFSYGVILLELITGRKALDKRDPSANDLLVSWVRPLLTKALEIKNFDSLADPRLKKHYNNDEMAAMVACAAACIRNYAQSRPLMSKIILVLEGDICWSNLGGGTTAGPSSSYGLPPA